ncbi:iron dicitrate transport regulator FecR [Massilia sp. CCM 8733]|uniref:Iron dicitrate transport regulator FecR n=1 Tax=Massilia mucilaginosa TaxID=2609282 RepID=A0ABX0NZH7_9BURK|nr:FecR domain-containing protein [Massilia mucilaginosa]NHZ92408.1 iron dicitrate transport regulator FecR [Massilia mucilaginosa]
MTGAEQRIAQEAAAWALRGGDTASQAGLAAWLAADARHRAAFDAMRATLRGVRALPQSAVAGLRAAIPAPPRAPAPRRLLALQACCAMLSVCVAGGAWLAWEHQRRQPTFSAAYATARGQQLTQALPDGSVITLDTATRIEVRLYRDRRELVLHDGQALFAVRSERARPFQVSAGAARVTVLGTRFAVRHTRTGLDANLTAVSVQEGRVRVRAGGGAETELGAGQAISAAADGRLGAVASVAPGAVAAWRDGRISFRNTPLALALAEFERYGRTALVLRDPAVGAMRVGGSYTVRELPAFAAALPVMLPVRLVERAGQTEIVALKK